MQPAARSGIEPMHGDQLARRLQIGGEPRRHLAQGHGGTLEPDVVQHHQIVAAGRRPLGQLRQGNMDVAQQRTATAGEQHLLAALIGCDHLRATARQQGGQFAVAAAWLESPPVGAPGQGGEQGELALAVRFGDCG